MNYRKSLFWPTALTLLATLVTQFKLIAFSRTENGIKPNGEATSGIRQKLRGRIRDRLNHANNQLSSDCTKMQIGGINVAVWKPQQTEGKAPLVIFSHGFGGSSTQSVFLMEALAQSGYIVIAPDHKDAHGSPETHFRPAVSFKQADQWSDKTYLDRHNDVVNLIAALRADPKWNSEINWNELALCGHSLGGYTVLGLAGAWTSWKLPGIKAVIALSPYVTPYTAKGALDNLHVPVMYQGGTKDFGITPFVKRPGGAFAKTSSPAYFVEFDQFNHFTWSSFNHDPERQKDIDYYCIAFLDKYVKGVDDGNLAKKLPDVVEYRIK